MTQIYTFQNILLTKQSDAYSPATFYRTFILSLLSCSTYVAYQMMSGTF